MALLSIEWRNKTMSYTPRTDLAWTGAGDDSVRRFLSASLEQELNDANRILAGMSRIMQRLIDEIKTHREEHARKYKQERRFQTTPDAS